MDAGGTRRPVIKLFMDGACIGNPDPGGWGFILKHPETGRTKEGSGGEHATTNNRMEITAVLRGLEALKGSCDVELFSDSEYVVNAITKWMANWKAFGWKRSAKAAMRVKNVDLWVRLDELLRAHELKANWVHGHAGHPENERCDVLACAAAAKVAATPAPARAAAVSKVDSNLLVNSSADDITEGE